MPRIKFRSSESEGWQPLPDGTYDIQIDEVDQKTTKNDNLQLVIKAHVVGGEYDAKKVTIFRVLTDKSGWKIELLLEATGIEFEKAESGQTNPETGKPLYDYDFDTDDLVGAVFRADVTTREYEGKRNNDFNNERAPEGAEKAQVAAPSNGAAEQAVAAPTQETTAAPASAPAQQAAEGGSRRRRMRS